LVFRRRASSPATSISALGRQACWLRSNLSSSNQLCLPPWVNSRDRQEYGRSDSPVPPWRGIRPCRSCSCRLTDPSIDGLPGRATSGRRWLNSAAHCRREKARRAPVRGLRRAASRVQAVDILEPQRQQPRSRKYLRPARVARRPDREAAFAFPNLSMNIFAELRSIEVRQLMWKLQATCSAGCTVAGSSCTSMRDGLRGSSTFLARSTSSAEPCAMTRKPSALTALSYAMALSFGMPML
jgi:hypothetical protein